MDRKLELMAIDLFVSRYGRTPLEYGVPVIDIFNRQRAFLYAPSKEALNAYKLEQNIIYWMSHYYILPVFAVTLLLFYAAFNYANIPDHPLIIVSVWALVILTLGLFAAWYVTNLAGKKCGYSVISIECNKL